MRKSLLTIDGVIGGLEMLIQSIEDKKEPSSYDLGWRDAAIAILTQLKFIGFEVEVDEEKGTATFITPADRGKENGC